MDKAKAAVSEFLHKDGKHDTTIHESVAPSVQHETVKPHHHENKTVATDREVHQDHYHRTVQPVQDREVLPEQHHHKLGAVEHRQFDHRDHEHTKNHLATEQAGFKNESIVQPTTHSSAAAPAVGGEHVHHHIHETIQPVVHKETVQPHVTHNTVPVHEVHHNTAKHHGVSELPPVSIGDFKAKGGVLGGRGEKYDAFEGEPRGLTGGSVGTALTGDRHHEHGHGVNKHDSHHVGTTGATTAAGTGAGLTGQKGVHDSHHAGTTGATTAAGTGAGLAGHHGAHDSHHAGTTGATTAAGTGAGLTGHNKGVHDPTTTGGAVQKPKLTDRLNPFKDADGDGKKGLMD